MKNLNDLKAILSEAIINSKLEFNNPLGEIQQFILDNYKLEFTQDEIENCLLELWHQDEIEEYEEKQNSELPNFIYV